MLHNHTSSNSLNIIAKWLSYPLVPLQFSMEQTLSDIVLAYYSAALPSTLYNIIALALRIDQTLSWTSLQRYNIIVLLIAPCSIYAWTWNVQHSKCTTFYSTLNYGISNYFWLLK